MHSELLISEIIPNGNFFTSLTISNNNQLHRHEFVEIFYVVSGSAIHILNGQKTTINSGDVYIIKPSDYHCFKSTDSTVNFIHRDICISIDEYKEICAFLDLPSFEELLNSATTLHTKLDADTITFLERTFSLPWISTTSRTIVCAEASLLLSCCLYPITTRNSLVRLCLVGYKIYSICFARPISIKCP